MTQSGSPAVLLYGDEPFLMDTRIDKIVSRTLAGGKEDFDFEQLNGDDASINRLVASANTLPFIAETRVVVANQPAFLHKNLAKADERLWLSYLHDPNPTCILIVKHVTDKKPGVLLKKMIECMDATLCEKPTGRALEEWAEKYCRKSGKILDRAALSYLASREATRPLGELANELEKVMLYSVGETVSAADLKMVMTPHQEARIFDLIDDVLSGHVERTYSTLRRCKDHGETDGSILYRLTEAIQQLLVVQSMTRDAMSAQMIATALKKPIFVVKKNLNQAKRLSAHTLSEALQYLLQCDFARKTLPGMDTVRFMEDTVLHLCRLFRDKN